MVLRYGINNHPYYDDVDEYYLGLSKETEYKKEASNPLEKEFRDPFEVTSAERYWYLKTMTSRTSRVFLPKKRRGSGGLGFTSMKTQCTDQEAKSTNSSVDEFVNPLGNILVPRKRRTSRYEVVSKNNYSISTDQDDNLRSKIKSSQEKKTIGRKRVLKIRRVNVEDDRQTASMKIKKLGKRLGFKKVGKRLGFKKVGKRVDFKKLGLYPPPDFSSQIKSQINYQEGRDSEIKLRIMKQIFQTDMDRHQDRFSMPLNQIKDGHEFLNKMEMEEVCQSWSKSTEVKLVELGLKDGNVHQSTMRLRGWQINNSMSYMLTSNWNDVLDRNEGALKLNDIVQVYSFRRDEKLWLVLVKVMDADDQVGNGQGNDEDGAVGIQIVHGVGANTGSESQAIVDGVSLQS